jgi:hypothetical protein
VTTSLKVNGREVEAPVARAVLFATMHVFAACLIVFAALLFVAAVVVVLALSPLLMFVALADAIHRARGGAR